MNALEKTEETIKLKKFMEENNIKLIEYSGDMKQFYGSDENQLNVVEKSGEPCEDLAVKDLILGSLDELFGVLENSKKITVGEGTVSLILDPATNVLEMKLDCTVLTESRVTENLQI